MTNRDVILAAIAAERIRQDALHGPELHLPLSHSDPTDSVSRSILTNARARVELLARRGELTFDALLDCELAEASAETDPRRTIAELVQVAALAVKAAEAVAHQNGITLDEVTV